MLDRLYYLLEQGFKGAPNTQETHELKEEIRLNIEEKYNELIAEGKTPQEAFEIVNSGLGDFREIVDELNKSDVNSRTFGALDGYTEGGTALDASTVKQVEIHWISGSVNVISGSGSEIRFYEASVSGRGEREKLAWRLDGDRLLIEYQVPRRPFSMFRFNFGMGLENLLHNWGKKLTVVIPESADDRRRFDRFTISSVSASIDIDGTIWKAGAIDLSTVNGALDASNLCADSVKLGTVNGQFNAEKIVCHTLKCSNVNGKIQITEPTCNDIKAHTVNGKVILEIPANIPGFTAKYNTVNGPFECDFPVLMAKKSATYGDGSAQYALETVNGGIKIAKL